LSPFSRRIIHFLTCAFVLAGIVAITPAFAATFTVTNGNASGPGSLRQAVLDANANGNPGEVDTITFSGVSEILQWDLDPLFQAGDITITESVAITGPGQDQLTINGQYSWLTSDGVPNGGFPDDPTSSLLRFSGNLFEIGSRDTNNSGIKVTISGMKVTATAGLVDAWEGAEVEIVDVFALENAFPTRNSASFVAGREGKLTIRDSTFFGNKWDGLLINADDAVIRNSTFVGNPNTSDFGYQFSGSATEITDSQILEDHVQHQFSAKDTYISNTVIRRIQFHFEGLIWAVDTNLHLNNVTIYAHSTQDHPNFPDQPSHLWLVNSKLFMANTVIAPDYGTHPFAVQALVRLENSTVSLNTNNHVSDGSLPGTATGLAGLEGPFVDPFSFKPVLGSPLIDTGDQAHAVNPRSGAPLTTDVLGGERIRGLDAEIGAVEIQANHAVNDSYTTAENTELNVSAPGVLSNDQVSGTLINNRIFVAEQPKHGQLTVVKLGVGLGGGFDYIPNKFFHGKDKFEYFSATENGNISNRGHVTITVSPAAPAHILIDKVTQPSGHPQVFDFKLTGGPTDTGDLFQIDQSFSLADGDANYDSGALNYGTYNLTETPVDGWATHGSCDDGSALDAIELVTGDSVTCTVTNVLLDSIVVQVATTPGGGTGFGFTHDIGAGSPFSLDDGQSEHFDSVIPGTYSLTQDDPSPGHDLVDIDCQGAAGQVVDLVQRKVTVTMAAGQTAHCTFKNEARGRILVEKVTNPDGDPQAFTFDLTGPDAFAQNFPLTDGQTHDSGLVTPGTYALAETVPAGWEISKSVCDDGSDPASIDVAPGETVTCTITNTEFDSVVVEVHTTPGGGTGFGFTHNIGAGTPFGLDDTQSEHFDSVTAGSYTITQDDPTPGHYLESIDCQGSYTSLVVDVAARSASFDVAAGQTAHCNFVNKQPGEIITDLVTDPSNVPQSFEFHLIGPENVNQSFHLNDGQVPRTSGDIVAGAYHLSTVVPEGWQLDGITCDDGSLHGDVDLQAGETVTCTVMQSLIPAPSFIITKTPDHNPVRRGEQIEYTISWENTGNGDAVGSILSDTLPEGTNFISASGAGVYDSGSNSVSWSLGTIAANSGLQSVMLVLRVGPTATIIDNVAVLSFNQDRMVVGSSNVQVEGMVPIPSLSIAGLLGLVLLLLSAGLILLRHNSRRN